MTSKKEYRRNTSQGVAVWAALTSRHQAMASKPSSQQCGEVFRRAFFLFFFMTEESKENPPPGGYGNDERDDTDRQRAEEAPVSRLEMETWEREGRVEICLLYTSPSPRDLSTSRMPSSA